MGEYSFDSQGQIVPGPDINELWGRKGRIVSRRNARKQNWLNTDVAFFRSNWKQSQQEMRMVLSYKKSGSDFSLTGNVSIDSDKNFKADVKAEFTIGKSTARSMFNVAFDRCATLGSITSDEGQGIRDEHRVYRFNDFSFYFKPRIR